MIETSISSALTTADIASVFPFPKRVAGRMRDNFAFSNFEGLVHKDSNIYEMPRFLVRDWDLDNFILNIKRFFRY